jgi:F-type H+-transporting ATPase subunit delta
MRKISSKKYAQALYELTRDLSKEQIKVEIDNFLKLVIRNKDLKKIDQIFNAYETYANTKDLIVNAEVISSANLSPNEKDKLKEQIKKEQNVKTVNLLEKVDKGLLGGFILKIGDTIFDASLKTRLEELRYEMKKS